MTFPVTVTYLNHSYIYDVETTDGVHFTCRRRPAPHAEFVSAPPDVIALEKEKPRHHDPSGEYKVQLHTDLMSGIETYLRQSDVVE